MNNGDHVVKNASAGLSARSSPQAKAASPASDRQKPNHRLRNGHNHSDEDSEAETVIQEDSNVQPPKEKKVIKQERNDDDNASGLQAIKEASRPRSPAVNGRRRRSVSDMKLNGVKNGERDVRSTSPSSRTASRHAKETSASPVPSTASPSHLTTRGRSSSSLENKKRKIRDESAPKSLEPLRQKAKIDGLKELRTQPTSPATPGIGNHRRSQSTQSLVGGATRKRREPTSITVPRDKNWSDSSSDSSTSPRHAQTPGGIPPHKRVQRSSHRVLTSPGARAMPHPKKNTDKFGATRLARECEKGEVSLVRAAYNAAPEELNQTDFAGITPLQKAALHGWSDVVAFLIEKRCRTDCESNDRDTPLIDAVENGHLEVVKLLLNKGRVNPHHQNKKGQRAIDVLDPDDEDYEELEKALKDAMRRETNTSKDDEYAQPGLGQKSASRLLYNEYNQETLIEKAGDGDIAAVGELINSNIKPNIACGVAASRGGHYDILSILLASGLKADPDPSKHSETPMLVAIGRGHLKIVNLLLEQDNFDPTRRNRDGKTYHEISEERRGPKWEQERDILKQALNAFRLNHKSPRRTKKEQPNTSVVRKRRSSPTRERSTSPRPKTKHTQLTQSKTAPQGPTKSRRLLSGKEMANRDVKRRRRVVSDETSEESEDEVRPPKKKPRSFSEGEEQKPVKKAIKARSEDHDAPKRRERAKSHDDSEEDHRKKSHPKIRQKTERVQLAKPTPEADSPDEKKPGPKIKTRVVHEKIKKRRSSEVSLDDTRVKKTPTPSAKGTPAPPEKASTPDLIRQQRQEAEQQAAEAKRKAAEAEAKGKEEEEAARKAAEEEAARKREEEAIRKEEEEAARKKAEEEEAKRREEEAEAEAARKREEEEARKRAEEARRQEELAARQDRISKLPRAMRRACELGNNRPLHFSGEELGISAVFLPLFYATSQDIMPAEEKKDGICKTYIMSFQACGILGLPELDLARLQSPYCDWNRFEVTRKQRELLLRQYDVALLAQDFRFPMEGSPDYDYDKIQASIKEARQQFLNMDGLYWIEDSLLLSEIEKMDPLKPLLEEIKDASKRRQIYPADSDTEVAPEKKHKPRKSFMDIFVEQPTVNGIKTEEANGEG
ncbi:hypothetical protein EJ04DRAFT_509395 [Polyplosphaeria fusca]|uniref:Uncharacterized protein n=1 Tax=Polyplosphaeria fusca TaxID=682080 RepID=A0A9P4R3X8_9PLEO|nr:hypothetical protein EJ04DRAFT_509395 [Polyplosphaeria fusca]